MAKKKKAPVKKIKSAKKKVVKNPHQGKRYFMLEFGGYGGELMFTTVPEDFVEYWLDEERNASLSDHIHAMHDMAGYGDPSEEEGPEGFDENSPEVYPGRKYVEYWELDDLIHDTVISAEYSSFTLTEIELHPKAVYNGSGVEWDDKECKKRNFDWSQNLYTEKNESKDYGCENVRHVYSVENFIHNTKKGLVDPVPVIMLYDAQKGTFGRVIVETNGEDFDIKKLVFATNENTMTTHIETYYYDKKPLDVNYDYLSTWGKGFHTSVGYIPKGDIEWDREELLELGWKDLEE